MADAVNMTKDDEIEIDLQELLGLLLHRIWIIAICGLAGGIAAFLISNFLIVPQYESSTSVYILNKNDSNTVTYSDVQLGTQLTKDYAPLITSRHVLESVIDICALTDTYEQLTDRVKVETVDDTRLIEITVTDPNPVMAQLIANEIRKSASERIVEVMDIQAVNVVDEANLPEEPASPSILKWTAIGLLLGVFLCGMILVVRFLLDDTIKTSDDVEKYLELSTLAMIPLLETSDGKKGRRARTAHEKHGEDSDELRDEEEEIDLDKEEMKEEGI